MPQFDATTVPRKTVTIAKLQIEAPTPYIAGHVLTEGEAQALNQVFIENVRNSMAAQMTKVEESLAVGTTFDREAWRPKIEEYFTNYEFGSRNSATPARAVADPVEREALSMARSTVVTAIKGKGYALKAVGEEQIMKLAKELLDAQPGFREQARRVVESRKAIGALSLDSFNLAGLAPAPAAPAAPEAEAPAA